LIYSKIAFVQSVLRYQANESLPYAEIKSFLLNIQQHPGKFELSQHGFDDCGEPMLLVELNKKNDNQIKILIMNAIHPGESEGTDACLEIVEQYIADKLSIPNNVSLHIIPVYNIGGYKNRKIFTRAGQNGPKEKGFRGNALNYDLNRDFIKADTRNTFAFYRIFHQINPHIFIDTHTSNGADYQHTLTLIESQSDKYRFSIGNFIKNDFTPVILNRLKTIGVDVIPYVNIWGKSPENGYAQFLETARYSTGYAALFGTIAYVTETHMLKPYPDRVEVTKQFIIQSISEASFQAETIHEERKIFYKELQQTNKIGINFTLDTSNYVNKNFKGYAYLPEKSKLGNYKIEKYHKEKPFEKLIKFYNFYKASDSVDIAKVYIIPSSQQKIIQRFLNSGVIMQKVYFPDSIWNVNSIYIKNYKTYSNPFEGHYLHYSTKTEKLKQKLLFSDTIYLVNSNQNAKLFIAETLEAENVDSYFNWNFFDIILQQKEGYSDYQFEDEAKQLLENFPEMRLLFDKWKNENPEKLNSKNEVLNYLFSISPYMEKEYMRIPIFSLED
jgi:hypothetical protein